MKLLAADDADIATLREMARWFRQFRPRGGGGRGDDELGQSPDIHVAWTGSGIGRVEDGAGTGTGTANDSGTGTDIEGTGDVPGYADCQIYRIGEDAYGRPRLQAMGFTLRVHNLNVLPIPAAIYVKIARLKTGKWVADTPGLDFGGC